MKDIRISNRFMRVFVLAEDEKRLVYIPVTALHRTDYDRLLDIEKRAGNSSMLEEMKKTKLDNGKNALVLYDNLIQVCDLTKSENGSTVVGGRLRKPSEGIAPEAKHVDNSAISDQTGEQPKPQILNETPEQPKPQKQRGPGRPAVRKPRA